jgi:uncharacterized membrane protein
MVRLRTWMSCLPQAYGLICWLILIFFIAAGGTFAFLMPPFQVPDEPNHWSSAHLRIDGLFQIDEEQHCSFMNALEKHFEASHLSFHSERRQMTGKFSSLSEATPQCLRGQIGYGSTLTYPGVLLGRLLGLGKSPTASKAIHMFYLSRILQGLILSAFLARFLWHSSKVGYQTGTLSLASLCLTPVLLQQSFGISADLVGNALAVALATTVVVWPRLTWIDVVSLTFIGVSSATTKPIIVVLVATTLILVVLLWWLPHRISTGKWLYPNNTLSPSAAAILVGLTFFCIYSGLTQSSVLTGSSPMPGANGARQLQFIKDHPWDALIALYSSAGKQLQLDNMISHLGWGETTVPNRYFCLQLIPQAVLLDMLRGVYLWWSQRPRTSLWTPLVCGIVLLIGVAGFYGLNALSMYLAWTPVGANAVDGLQGRYFIPAYVLIFACGPFLLHQSSTASGGEVSAGGSPKIRAWTLTIVSLVTIINLLKYWVDLAQSLLTRYW